MRLDPRDVIADINTSEDLTNWLVVRSHLLNPGFIPHLVSSDSAGVGITSQLLAYAEWRGAAVYFDVERPSQYTDSVLGDFHYGVPPVVRVFRTGDFSLTAKATAHEVSHLAHAIEFGLKSFEGKLIDFEMIEVVAEASAFMILSRYNVDMLSGELQDSWVYWRLFFDKTLTNDYRACTLDTALRVAEAIVSDIEQFQTNLKEVQDALRSADHR